MPTSTHSGFLSGPNGFLHLTVLRPAPGNDSGCWVLLAPPFAEEMNKCRPMLSRQARRMAERGVSVVLPDLTGTGDSGGEFSVATWEGWQADLCCIADWCAGQGATRLVLWGVRLGCLLALDTLNAISPRVSAVLMWQPVFNGRLHLNQFLRLRVAAGMMRGGTETVADLREKLDREGTLDVAGYELPAGLYASIDALSAADLDLPDTVQLVVHEVVTEAQKPLLPVTSKQLESWRGAGLECEERVVVGSQFWLTQEIGFAMTLLDAGSDSVDALLMRWAAEPAPTDQRAGEPAKTLSNTAGSVTSVRFDCEGQQLLGQLHRPLQSSSRGVLVVVGGPQYRVGSHRQFVQLARTLCESGVPVLRFDYRGMGDAEGELQGFEHVEPDIGAAIDAFQREYAGLSEVVIWGLCDAATAATFYACKDKRVLGLVLLNPWVHSAEGAARAYLKHYYLERFFSRDLWRKILRGDFQLGDSLRSVGRILRDALGSSDPGEGVSEAQATEPNGAASAHLADRMAGDLQRFAGPVLLLLSGNDLTAAEFEEAAKSHPELAAQLQGAAVQVQRFPGADHTFSQRDSALAVERATAEYVLGL